jgi:mono/diheme cytochrome c family protein
VKPRSAVRTFAAVLGGAVTIFASAALAAPPEPPGFRLDGDAQRGRAVYAKTCVLCHGEAGNGRGKLAAGLDPKPKDFTAPGLLAQRSDWEIYLVIRDGGQAIGLSSKMAGWSKVLKDQQIRDAAAYVRSLAPVP